MFGRYRLVSSFGNMLLIGKEGGLFLENIFNLGEGSRSLDFFKDKGR